MQSKIESAVIPSLLLKVDEREYIVEFPLRAVAAAEAEIGRPLRCLQDWFSLQAKDIPAVLAAGLEKHHARAEGPRPLAIASEICDRLNPEALDEVAYALCKLAFPRRMAAIEKDLEKEKKSPNV